MKPVGQDEHCAGGEEYECGRFEENGEDGVQGARFDESEHCRGEPEADFEMAVMTNL